MDAGCGAGRQTIALAGNLRTTIHAIDCHQPFLDELAREAERAGVGSLIEPRCMDMSAIPEVFSAAIVSRAHEHHREQSLEGRRHG